MSKPDTQEQCLKTLDESIKIAKDLADQELAVEITELLGLLRNALVQPNPNQQHMMSVFNKSRSVQFAIITAERRLLDDHQTIYNAENLIEEKQQKLTDFQNKHIVPLRNMVVDFCHKKISELHKAEIKAGIYGQA